MPDVRFIARARLRLSDSSTETGFDPRGPTCVASCLIRSLVCASSLEYCSERSVSFETAVTYESSWRSAASRRSASRTGADDAVRGVWCLRDEPGCERAESGW
eukprot:scaffold155299_cov22-Tisochrysis_lutea.AAC.1